MDNSGVNLMMAEYEENVNVIAKINAELCKRYGLEHYLSEFSSNLITALNQYKRFVLLMNNRKELVEAMLSFSNSCIDFFKANLDPKNKEPQATLEKMDKLVKRLNEINDIINKNFAEEAKQYLDNEK